MTNKITSLSPLDSRYNEKISDVTANFSDLHLTLTRIAIEIEWFKTLANITKVKEIKKLSKEDLNFLDNIIVEFSAEDIERIKELEKETNHDVKAIEYFLKEKIIKNKKLRGSREFIHFGCTSDDINNLSYAVLLSKCRDGILLPSMKNIIKTLGKIASDYAEIPMLSRTHGQPATPTTLGKEFANFVYRLTRQFDYLFITPILGKFNGAVGNFNAHSVAYPDINWQKIEQKFIEELDLTWNPYTTQIEPHDWIAEYCDIIARFNTILIDFCRDIWSYISIGYLKQKSTSKEVGSSTMPHKINPIDFENAEGNLGLANSLLSHFSSKLPISRYQRDLTDSTVMRNIGVAIGHSVLALRSIEKGLTKITVDKKTIKKDLNDNWGILAEAIQTVMRRYNIENPYEQMKSLTRGQKVDKKALHKFIKKLNLPQKDKERLLKLTPENYLGKARELAKDIKKTSSLRGA